MIVDLFMIKSLMIDGRKKGRIVFEESRSGEPFRYENKFYENK